MASYALVDTGFWYARYNIDDQFHKKANNIIEYFEYLKPVVLWPCLYETLNTQFVGKAKWLKEFQDDTKRLKLEKIPDEAYREQAFENVFKLNKGWPKYSLADLVVREMLQDNSIKLDVLVTFNESDFADLCAPRRIEILNG